MGEVDRGDASVRVDYSRASGASSSGPWLYIVSMNPEALQKYASWLPGRSRRPFIMPEHAVLVGMKDPSDPSDAGVLVSGVGLFPTKGVFLMVEQFATNPEVSARVRHAAAEFSLEAVKVYAAIRGQLPFFITSTLGLYKLAKKQGWVPHAQAAVLEADPTHPVVPLTSQYSEPRAAVEKRSPPRPNRGPLKERQRRSDALSTADTLATPKVPRKRRNGKKSLEPQV